MRERPMLFNGVMVRAILSGAKTQTRRALRDQSPVDHGAARHGAHLRRVPMFDSLADRVVGTSLVNVDSPFGQPGDRLWVRETWMPGYFYEADHEDGPKVSVIYRADNCESVVAAPSYELAEQWDREFSDDGDDVPPWRPSIHMPRWACRLVLEITDVRVERLQAISEADVCAEGIEAHTVDGVTYYGPHGQGDVRHDLAFRDLWTSTGTDWESNPWVWVIGFRLLEASRHHAASDTTKETRDGRS